MAVTVAVSHEALIDWLEQHLGNVFEHIKENDQVEKVVIGYVQLFITIGEAPEGGITDDRTM